MAQETGRRAEYAAATRQAILQAARDLFADRGYFDTRVEDIARAARVAVPTVYAAAGGKSGLLRTLIEDGIRAAESGDIYARIAAQTDPEALLDMLIEGTRTEYELWSPIMRQATAAAPQDATIRKAITQAHTSLREGLKATATRLAQLNALPPETTVDNATNTLWYYLNNKSWQTLTEDCTQTPTQATTWLKTALTTALLTPPKN